MRLLFASLVTPPVIWMSAFAFAHERDGPVSIETTSIEHLADHLGALASNPDWAPSFTDPSALRAAMQAAAAEHDESVMTAIDIGKVYLIYSLVQSGELEPDGSNLSVELSLKASSEITKEEVVTVAGRLKDFVAFEGRLSAHPSEHVE